MDYTPASHTFDDLLGRGAMPICRAPFLDASPAGVPASWDRIEGMLLGLAIGDALGNTTEGLWPADRRYANGEVRDYIRRAPDGARVGVASDDTQLAFWTLEHLLEPGALDLQRLATAFTSRRILGIGSTVQSFVWAVGSGEPWENCAPRSAGNGALMRIAPALVPHVASPSAAVWHDTALIARLTHNDTASVASCLAMISMLWRALAEEPNDPRWWADTFLAALEPLCLDDRYESGNVARPEAGRFPDLVRARLERAHQNDWSTEAACNHFWSGAYLLETVPCVLWILERHGHDPEEAIVRAVNDTFDNDTVAAIVGAAVGARYGANSLPLRWKEGLTGRTSQDDNGRVQHLISEAKRRFWNASRPAR